MAAVQSSPTRLAQLAILTDAELSRMTDRAYREAARSWGEFRAFAQSAGLNDRATTAMLRTSADSADLFYDELRAEMARRREVKN